MRRLPLHRLLLWPPADPRPAAKRPKTPSTPTRARVPTRSARAAHKLDINKPHTDEVSYANQDQAPTGTWSSSRASRACSPRSSTGTTSNSDVNVDVFDAFGAQIAASPVRGKGEKHKKLFTQIDKPGTYYVRVTAPTKIDGTVYTMEAQWQEPPAVVVTQPPPPPPVDEKPVRGEAEAPRLDAARAARAAREAGGREHPGARGFVLPRRRLAHDVHRQGLGRRHPAGRHGRGAAGRRRRRSRSTAAPSSVIKVIDANKCVGPSSLHSLGKNNRVAITLSR